MNQEQRLLSAFRLRRPDRAPILGGWLAAPSHIISLTGCTEDEYWDDLFAGDWRLNGFWVPTA
jgi:hypothetical protein